MSDQVNPPENPSSAAGPGFAPQMHNPVETAHEDLRLEMLAAEEAASSGARWFYWIVGGSIINSIAMLLGSDWSFLVGLGFTQVIDGFAAAFASEMSKSSGDVLKGVAFGLDIVIASTFFFFGWFAVKKRAWGFIAGMVFYTLDGLLFVLFADWFSVAFHVFALWCIFAGFKKLRRAEELALLINELEGQRAHAERVDAQPVL